MKQLAWDAKMKEAVQALIERGAFLTTQGAEIPLNTMAIGWGAAIGYCWGQTGLYRSGEEFPLYLPADGRRLKNSPSVSRLKIL